MRAMARAMSPTAMVRKPSARSSGVRALPVAAETSRASSANRAAVAAASSGWSPFGPNTLGKNRGSSLPSSTLQSVTVSGPPRP